MHESFALLPVDSIDYDPDNPRIKKALEKYGDKLNDERIYFALRAATEGAQSSSSYTSLRDSIRAHRGISTPIAVARENGRFICIDGNTRLAIFKRFIKEEVEGDWSTIKALILEQASPADLERVRVAAHLVGPREWPAYEKARHLHYLRNKEFLSYDEMIALCGGNKTKIERQIDAYHDMNEYYRNLVDDTAFHIDRFSGFEELQKPGVKDAIHTAGLELRDFGEWIRDGKIYRLADVRKLPKVLGDTEARRLFLEGGPRSIESAIRYVEDREAERRGRSAKTLTLEAASVHELVEVLSIRINELPYSEVRSLKDRANVEATARVAALDDLSQQLTLLLADVGD